MRWPASERRAALVALAPVAPPAPVALAGLLLLLLACAGGVRRAEAPASDAAELVNATRHRPDVAGRRGAVVADHPLAAAAGIDVLRSGGNAVDAAVTMAAVLAVVRPHMNGIGGDAFALFYEAESGRVTALNASGRAGALATPEFFAARGLDRVPESGALAVTVPGAVSGWAAALERYGTIRFGEALAPAIHYADQGFPVSATLVRDIGGGGASRLNPAGRAIYDPLDGLHEGALLRSPELAATLRRLASEGPGALYGGEVGRRLAAFIEAEDGHLRLEDFAQHRADWVEPISTDVAGRRVYAMPPNSQGLVQLQQIRMAAEHPLETMGHNSERYLHTLIELKKLAFADRDRWVADPAVAPAPVARLLGPLYLFDRSRLVGERAAERVAPGFEDGVALSGSAAAGSAVADGDGDTVYLMAVDQWGNAVSWIQSLYFSFGSQLLDPATGVVLHNRGAGFTLEDGHPNVVAPGKRPFHTLTPMLVTGGDGRLEMTIGTPGGNGQSQFLTQVFHNIFTFGMSPQEAVEAPRFLSGAGRTVDIEDRVPAAVRRALERRGHELRVGTGWAAVFGGVQVIRVEPGSRVLRTGADPRREAYAVAY